MATVVERGVAESHVSLPRQAALTPPTSEDNDKRDEASNSDLSDVEMDEKDDSRNAGLGNDGDEGEDVIEPDHYYEGGKIPVFKPVRADPRALSP